MSNIDFIEFTTFSSELLASDNVSVESAYVLIVEKFQIPAEVTENLGGIKDPFALAGLVTELFLSAFE